METHDKVKKGMEVCSNVFNACMGCPYEAFDGSCQTDEFAKDCLAYSQQLEEEKARLECSLTQLSSTIRHLRDVESRLPRWISVEERQPEHWHMDDKDKTLINYLVYSPDYGVDVGNYVKSAKRWVCMGLPMNVTHWMLLPEPPKEG